MFEKIQSTISFSRHWKSNMTSSTSSTPIPQKPPRVIIKRGKQVLWKRNHVRPFRPKVTKIYETEEVTPREATYGASPDGNTQADSNVDDEDALLSETDGANDTWPTICQQVYAKACALYHVTPSSYFFRHLNDLEIIMPNNAIGAKGLKAIATALVTNVTVQRLNVSGNEAGTEGLQYILDLLEENTTIADINVSSNSLGSLGAEMIRECFVKNRQIRWLNISDNGFSDKDSRAIAEILLYNSTLEGLGASRNSFGETAGFEFGHALAHNSNLKSLDLSWNHIRLRGAVTFCWGLRENQTIEKLNLSWNGFGIQGCHEMGKVLKVNHSIIDLDLSANRVSLDAFRQILKGLVRNKTIKCLKIGSNPITTDGATSILRAVADERCGALCHLDLTDVSVDNDFVTLLSAIQKERPLYVKYGITLRHDDIKRGDKPIVLDTDDPVTILFEFMRQKNLRVIDLLHFLDKDHSETLTRGELSGIDIPLSQRSLDLLMSRLDVNRDGHINFEELVAKHKEYQRRVAKLRKKADTDYRHSANFDRLQQLREAVRLRMNTSTAFAKSVANNTMFQND